MKSCEGVQNNLIFYIEDEIHFPGGEAINDHLLSCSDCKLLYNEIKATFEIIETEKKLLPSYSFSENILQNIFNDKEQPKGLSYTLKQILAYAAVIAMGIFIGTLTGNMLDSKSNQDNDQLSQDVLYWNDFQQEPIESFLVTD